MHRSIRCVRVAGWFLVLTCSTPLGAPPIRAEPPREIAAFKEHTGHPYALAFSPDGKTLAWACTDKTIRLWDVTAARERARLQHQDVPEALAFSPDGKTLASTCRDGLLRLWAVAAGKERAAIDAGYAVLAVYQRVLFSPDGKSLVSSTKGEGLGQLWDVETKRERLTLKGPPDQDDVVLSTAFSPDGKVLAVLSSQALYLFDSATVKLRSSFKPARPAISGDIAFSPDGKQLVRLADDLSLLDLATGKEQPVRRKEESGRSRLVTGPGGKVLAYAGWRTGDVKLWDATTGELLASWKTPAGDVIGLAVSPDGRRLAAVCGDDKKGYEVRLWDVSGLKLGVK
jgi:WD40 repeat protein